MPAFLAAAFTRRLRFGLPLGVDARFVLQAARLTCWRCQARTQLLRELEVKAGPHEVRFPLADLGHRPGLWDTIRPRLPSSFPSGSIRPRFGKAQGQKVLSNGCSHCGALIGEPFRHKAGDDTYAVCDFSAPLNEPWRAAILSRAGSITGWGVY